MAVTAHDGTGCEVPSAGLLSSHCGRQDGGPERNYSETRWRMHITYHPAMAEDLEPATRIVQDAYNDLRVRYGLAASISRAPPLFQTFSLAEPSSSLWVAEAEGVLQGFAFAWMRQRFWFLSQLFVRPGT